MSLKKKNRQYFGGNRKRSPSPTKRAGYSVLLGLVALAAIAALLIEQQFPHRRPLPVCPSPPLPSMRRVASLDELVNLTPDQLAQVDIAEMNLLCATGLPGAETLDIPHAMTTLDNWANRVMFETNRHLYRVNDPRYADAYRHSEAYLRANFVLQVLQEDLGVKYDLSAAHDFSFKDSHVAFLHGMIPMPGQTMAQIPGGTCSSMPVLYIAVGRRLGYPLKLVATKGHLFVRWDGTNNPNPVWRERFNIEGTNGFSSFPDEYYRTWPFKLTEEEVQANGYLVSFTPGEELAEFLAARGHCLLDNGRAGEAFEAYVTAHRFAPTNPAYLAWAQGLQVRRPPSLVNRGPEGFYEPPIAYQNVDPLAQVDRINAINRANMERLRPPSAAVPHQHAPHSYQPPEPGRARRP